MYNKIMNCGIIGDLQVAADRLTALLTTSGHQVNVTYLGNKTDKDEWYFIKFHMGFH